MKKKSAGFWVGVAILFAAAAYSAIVFLLKKEFDTTAWVLYGFTMAAFLLVGLQFVTIASARGSVVMDTAQAVVTGIYFGIQLIFGGMILMSFDEVALSPVIVGEIVVLGLYLFIAFMVIGVQSHMSAQDQTDRSAVKKMRLFEAEVLKIADKQTDPQLISALKGLAEAIHFSDIVSLPELEEVELRIGQQIALLEQDTERTETDPYPRIKDIHRLLKERDRMAAIAK
jgi:hypothetical protein